MTDMPRPEQHLFVCVNERPAAGKPSCGARGSAALFAALQRAVGSRPELWGRVAVTGCACLGPCFEGPTLVVYPQGVWYRDVQPGDAEEIVERHLCAGQPVERLRYRWQTDGDDDSQV
jgi:(2Fe-2S) ferredoxin